MNRWDLFTDMKTHDEIHDSAPRYRIVIEELKHPGIGYSMGSQYTAQQVIDGLVTQSVFNTRQEADDWIRSRHFEHLKKEMARL